MQIQQLTKKSFPGMRFRIEEPAGIARDREPVRFGVPFAEGEWPAGISMDLDCSTLTGTGRVHSCSWDITQRWPDGSVRLAFCRAEIEIGVQAIVELTPKGRTSESRTSDIPAPPDLTAIEGISLSVTIDGKEQNELLTIKKRPENGLNQDKSLKNSNVLQYGELKPINLQVEGTVVTGSLRALSGRNALYSITICNGGREAILIDRLRIAVDGTTLIGDGCRAQLGSDWAGLLLEESERPEFLQLSRIGSLTTASGEKIEFQYPLGGEYRRNVIYGRVYTAESGAMIAVRNMGENFPCGISLGKGTVFFDLRPETAKNAGKESKMELAGGMSKTYEFGIVYDQGGADGSDPARLQLIYHPLVVTIPTHRLEQLGCFGTLGPYLPRKFPKLENWIKWMMANHPRAYGWKNFGDEPAFGYMPRAKDPSQMMFLNNEYDFPLVALGQFCRTGDKIAYEDGRAAVLHMMDIDTIAADSDPLKVGGQYSHSPGHTTHPPAPDHEWLEGLLLWHLLTGDRRPLDAARALADRHVKLTESGMFDKPGMTARRYGWPLVALCSFYAFSQEQKYLDAAKRVVEGMRRVEQSAGSLRSPYWGLPYWSLDTFMLGIAAMGLCRYHAVTGCADTREMILRSCDAIISLETPEGILPYKEHPMVRVNEPVSTTITLEALAYGFKLSGKREYLALGARNLEYTFEMLRNGSVIDWNSEQREDFPGGAYMRARTIEMTSQLIGLLVRGIWPFMATAEKAGIFGKGRNPFAFTTDFTLSAEPGEAEFPNSGEADYTREEQQDE